jgi:general secretion pathway protein E
MGMEEVPQHERDRQLGEILVEAGKISRSNLDRVLELQRKEQGRIGAILARLGLVSERDLAEVLAEKLNLAVVGPEDYPEIPILENHFSLRFLKLHTILPIQTDEDAVVVAVADPLDDYAIRAIELLVGRQVAYRVGTAADIDAAIERLYGSGRTRMAQIVEGLAGPGDEASEEEIAHLKDLASEAPVIRLVNLIIQNAVEQQASDIHVEPFESELKVRYRVDGVLHEVEAPPMRLYAAVVSRIKIMARLDIAERRLPQDGRIRVHVQGREIDIRVSSLPTMFGESLVLRLLYKDSAVRDFAALGFSERVLAKFLETLKQPHGILLVTGPTGSGKTTTLYAALSELNRPTRKIVTVEDPVEYQLVGINQIQVKPQIGLTFARALRAIVRQDPDVIMLGEMRDLETAEIAVQSALTGHLVLSTLHTNDAAGSVTRLLDMGIPGYLVTSVVNGVLAQRLVRRLCPRCRETYAPLPELVAETGLGRLAGGPVTLYRPVGCDECNGTGYRGRTAVMEILVMDDAIRSLVIRNADAREIATASVAGGMRTMYEDGLLKALDGTTSLEEVLRVARDR